jgi:uncharacterized membrane protein
MTKNRIETFSDGVVAIIITIMVLEMKLPERNDIDALRELTPVFLAYVLSFANIGIYWNNHHHMFQAVKHVSGWVLWANLHWLFWLSLIPFVTGFMSESGFHAMPVALYAIDLTLCAVAYLLLMRALGSDLKGKLSLTAYVVAIPAAFAGVWISLTLFVVVAAAWIVPDRRFSRVPSEG